MSFSKDEARDIVYALTVDRLIDRDGKLTDKYKEERFGKEAVELLPEPCERRSRQSVSCWTAWWKAPPRC